MADVSTNNGIVVDPNQPKRIIAIIDEPLVAWWEQNMTALRVIKNPDLRSGMTVDSEVGRFEYLYTKEGEVLLTSKPEHLSLGEAYNYILKNF
jgi:hypothetical protein